MSEYFVKCSRLITDHGANSVVVSINGDGEFLHCSDTVKFRNVAAGILNDLRADGLMVAWSGTLWREVFPFIDSRGKIKKGTTVQEKFLAMAVLEKQLYRKKAIMRCMFPAPKVNSLDAHVDCVQDWGQ